MGQWRIRSATKLQRTKCLDGTDVRTTSYLRLLFHPGGTTAAASVVLFRLVHGEGRRCSCSGGGPGGMSKMLLLALRLQAGRPGRTLQMVPNRMHDGPK